MPIKTLEQLEQRYHELFYVEDTAVFPLVMAAVIGAKLNAPPTWLYIIGPSSGGKSQLLACFNKVQYVTELSDLTTNTFLSGMKRGGQETSLLKKLGNNFLIVMKDFTTLISKDDAAKGPIIAQMREIYDGYISKATGNGDTVEWGTKEKRWKGTFIMAATEGIYKLQEEFADMGTRAINYVFVSQDRKKTTRAALKNKRNNDKFSIEFGLFQDDVRDFVMDAIERAPYDFDPIPNDVEEEIIEVADLSSQCRSVVIRNYRGEKTLALSAEFPMRMAEQLLAMTQLLMYINNGNLTPEMKYAIYKTAFDSIPKQRRMILETVARYDKIEILGMAKIMNYPPELVRSWVEDLNMFGIIKHIEDGRKEYWAIKDESRAVLKKFLGIDNTGEVLESDENGLVQMKDLTWQERQRALETTQSFNNMFD
jgi:hypothetical protein